MKRWVGASGRRLLVVSLSFLFGLLAWTPPARASHGEVDQQQTAITFPFCDQITGQTFTPLVDNIVGFDLSFAEAAIYTFEIRELATGTVVASLPGVSVTAGVQQIDLAAETPLNPSTRYLISIQLLGSSTRHVAAVRYSRGR